MRSTTPQVIEELCIQLYKDAKLLEQMRAIYPGDSDGSIGLDACVLKYAADTLADLNWREVVADYREKHQITVTVYDEKGNVVSESTG